MGGKNNLVGIFAVLIIVGCLASFIYRQFSQRSKVDLRPYADLGALVAQETSKLLPAGAQVAILVVDTAHYHIPTLETLLTAFRKELKKKRDLTIISVEKFRVSPGTFMALTSGTLLFPTADVSSGRLESLLQAPGRAQAIVSFVGLPASLHDNSEKVLTNRPRIVVVANQSPELLSALRARAIDLAIVPASRPPAQKAAESSGNRARWQYDVLTPDLN